MVSIPAGEAHLGYRDSTVTMKLIEKYKLTANPIFVDILKSSPRKVTLASYFIDKTEVTNAQYRKFLAAVKARGDAACRHPSQPAEKKDHTPDSETWKDPTFNQDTQPVVAIDWYDAYAYAEWANKRLPTEDEWQLAARGKEAFAYPWGNSYEPGRANIDQDQARAPAPVGRFAGDRSPFGLLDMAGNVSEWTATEGEEKNSRVTCGGAWNCRDGDVLGLLFLRRFADPDVRRAYRGLRCAADARPGASAPGDMIRIPGGEVTLGGETGPLLEFLRSLPVKADLIQKELLSEKPRNVKLPAFRICRYEVTNAQYRRFLDYVRANGDAPYRHSDQPPGKDHTPQFWNDPDLNGDDKPVVGVDWYDAYAFAKWVGMRLPTADEWEYAARGNTDNLYPWGDTFSAGKCNGAEAGAKGTASVGSFSTDCSPFGAMDMGGNVWEWTADDCPGTEGKAKRLKGGAWTADCKLFAVIYLRLRGAVLSYRDNSIGFRYAQDVSTP
jgi:formylglycine-generating enzyme required for sulfatase activity